MPKIAQGERVYIVAWGRVRGYAPLIAVEPVCSLNPERSCLVRAGGAVAVTIPRTVTGFQGWRYRFWDYEQEHEFPEFARANVDQRYWEHPRRRGR